MARRNKNFKETEIGLIPEDWEVVKLEYVAKVETGQSAPQGEIYFKDGKYPFIRVSHLSNESFKIISYDLINDKAVKDYNLKLFPKGSVIFPKSGASIFLEKRARLPFGSYVVSHLCVVNSNSNTLSQDFLFYALINKRFSKNKDSNYPTLNITEIKSSLIPLPPLSEQKAIAHVLKTIQDAIEATEKVIAATKELKKSLMKHLFTYGPVPVSEKDGIRLKETEIGLIPEDWEVVKLEEVCEFIRYGYQTSIPKVSADKGIPIISVADITDEGKILWNCVRKIDIETSRVENHFLTPGEILFNWRNSPNLVGKTAVFNLANEKVICASFILRIRVKSEVISNIFLHYFISYLKLKGFFEKRARRAVNQTNFNASILKNISIPLPPLPVQQKIARILKAVDDKIEIEEKKKEALQAFFKPMLHHLMTGKIRVKPIEIGEG